ncbi:MAG TPA: tRNA (N6-threonylcarbamoyladenosine(37)-N6)-methyltransferase TrmO [Bacteriovoracaceae bacterium]|nr:tRNA (N6-threonylcarbamoyladenosine(37)-N6)-methyltransferase TrmO [Bacteriovoracaceae bacterium]
MQHLCLIETPFQEKFGVPRQPLLVKEAWGKLTFPKNDFYAEAFRGIEEFSHLWLIFEFHQIEEKEFCALVRPPRFYGKKKMGVFATRSPHRLNRLGLSVVEFDRLEIQENSVVLWVKGVDLVSGTPILDIKPYIPYCDSIAHAQAPLFDKPQVTAVRWACEKVPPIPDQRLIEAVISLDPRPGHENASGEEFGVSLSSWNVRFQKQGAELVIVKITLL